MAACFSCDETTFPGGSVYAGRRRCQDTVEGSAARPMTKPQPFLRRFALFDVAQDIFQVLLA